LNRKPMPPLRLVNAGWRLETNFPNRINVICPVQSLPLK
jgi:hypothetical protein